MPISVKLSIFAVSNLFINYKIYVMDNSVKAQRRRKYFDLVSGCDAREKSESILIDKIVDLEDCLNELQQSYSDLLIKFKNFVCVPDLS